MGNTCCSTFCSSDNEIAMDLTTLADMVQDVDRLDQLISIIEERLKAIAIENQSGQQNTTAQQIGSSSWFASCTNFGKDLVDKVLKRANKRPCKVCFKSGFNSETRKVVIEVLKEASQIHSLAAALCVVGYVLQQIDQLSSNRDQCIQLLRYICALARRVKQLDDRLPAEKDKLNEALHFIFKGCLLCLTQMKSHKMSRLFYASVDAADLLNLESQIRNTYPDLILGALIAVLDNMPRFLPPTQGEDPSAVGIQEAKNRVISLLKMDLPEESKRAVVVYGVGGIGKTTLATAVFNSLDLKAYTFCRVDMDQNCSIDHIKQLQQQILHDLFGQRIALRSPVEGQDRLTQAFTEFRSPIFMFIDNALEASDLTKLLPKDLSKLPRKTRVLLTTRRLDQTNIFVQTDFERYSFSVDGLSPLDSKKLLCKIALGSANASFPDGIKSLDVDEIVEMCGGIPLVLELIGSRLKNSAIDTSAIKSLKESVMEGGVDISERVVDVVYNTLDELCKEAFLDIVCFFNKQSHLSVSCVVGKVQLEALENAALVKVNFGEDSNAFYSAVRRGKKLSKPHRILDLESCEEAVQDRQKIKGISIPRSVVSAAYEIEAEQLDLMHTSLRVLRLPEFIKVNGICQRSFESLKYVTIDGLLPIDLKKVKRLAVLEGTVADNVAELPASLRYISLKNSPNLPALLQCFGNLSSLEYLNLDGCEVLVTVPTSISQFECLKVLDLRGCLNLTTLPDTFGNLFALIYLVLSDCSKLACLPPTFGKLKSLCFLFMNGCEAVTTLPNSFGNLSALTMLSLSSCSNLLGLPDNFGELKSLKVLDLSGCDNLKTLKGDFASLTSLMAVDASNCQSLRGEAMDILVKMKSLMRVDIYGSDMMMERWKVVGQHYPLMVFGGGMASLASHIDGPLHTVEHTLFHSGHRQQWTINGGVVLGLFIRGRR